VTDPAQQIAEALLAARRTGKPVAHGALPPVADSAVAYAVQALTACGLGAVGGYKAGRANPNAPLILAPIMAGDIRASGATIPLDQSRLRGVELEVGFRVVSPLPAHGSTGFLQALAAAVTPILALEIVESRLFDPDDAGALWKLADNQINGGLIVGPEGDLAEELEAQLRIGDKTVVQGRVTNPAGPPLFVLAAFVELAAKLGVVPVEGQIILTGSLTGLRYAGSGQLVQGRIAGLGEVCCHFAPDPGAK